MISDKDNKSNVVSIRQKLKMDDEEFKKIHSDFMLNLLDYSKNYVEDIKSLIINFTNEKIKIIKELCSYIIFDGKKPTEVKCDNKFELDKAFLYIFSEECINLFLQLDYFQKNYVDLFQNLIEKINSKLLTSDENTYIKDINEIFEKSKSVVSFQVNHILENTLTVFYENLNLDSFIQYNESVIKSCSNFFELTNMKLGNVTHKVSDDFITQYLEFEASRLKSIFDSDFYSFVSVDHNYQRIVNLLLVSSNNLWINESLLQISNKKVEIITILNSVVNGDCVESNLYNKIIDEMNEELNSYVKSIKNKHLKSKDDQQSDINISEPNNNNNNKQDIESDTTSYISCLSNGLEFTKIISEKGQILFKTNTYKCCSSTLELIRLSFVIYKMTLLFDSSFLVLIYHNVRF